MINMVEYWDKDANEGHGDNRRLKGNDTGPYVVPSIGPYAPLAGEKDVEAANTPAALSTTSIIVAKLNIKAKRDNAGYVAVGDNSINANEGSEKGYPLEAEEPMPTMEHVDLAEVYVTSPNIGDGITYTAIIEPSE